MTDVVTTEEYRRWFVALKDHETEAVRLAVYRLSLEGVLLDRPHSSAIHGASKLRELRPNHGHSPLRAFYRFDPKRRAVLLLGGTKADKRLYDRAVERCERLWREYLDE